MSLSTESPETRPLHLRFSAALADLLADEYTRSLSSARLTGWAAQHTAALDRAFEPAASLVQLALGKPPEPTPTLPDLSLLPGRPIYRPLLAYALARSGQHTVALAPVARQHAGSTSAVGVWWALTLAACGESTSVFDELLHRQRPTGEFFDASPYDSPDLHWYDELVVLHAVATHARLSHKPGLDDAAARAARFHTEETQPDHATSQPWAIHAFCRTPHTLPMAELLLHGALAQNAGRLDAIGRILLADAVLSL